MKISWLLITTLLLGMAGMASADYAIVIVNSGLSTAPAAAEPDITIMLEARKPIYPTQRPIELIHKWGKSYIMPVDQRVAVLPATFPTVAERYKKQSNAVYNTGKPPTSEQFLDLAEWALAHRLFTEFTKAMDTLVKTDKNHPAAVAYQKVQADLARPTHDDNGAGWKKNLDPNFKVARLDKGGHYVLLHKLPKDDTAEIKTRLEYLEEAFRGFFYWFALRSKDGTVPTVPDQRLQALLILQPKEFDRFRQIFDAPPLLADGFYARPDNLLVLSATRRDPAYENLVRASSPWWQKIDRDQLLKGNNAVVASFVALSLQERQDIHVAALMLKVLEDDSELSTISYLATRQIIDACGLLPRAVLAPEWIQCGLAAFFATARGAAWPSLGAAVPSADERQNYLSLYKQWSSTKQLESPVAALKNVITDAYYRQSVEGKRKDAAPKAQALSWALTYYLLRNDKENKEQEGLMRYFKELSKLPRDLEFDEDVLLLCFARAFDLLTNNKADEAKLAKFANAWNDFIMKSAIEGEEILKELRKPRKGGWPQPK